MEGWVCLLLLLHCTAVTVSQSCAHGEIKIVGVESDITVAGRLEICVEGEWFAVYDENWSREEAMIVCEEKGYPREGARACNESCFGDSSLESGYHFTCEKESNKLSACQRRHENCCCLDCINLEGERSCCPFETDVCFRQECHSNAGVICVRLASNSSSSECPAPQQDDTTIPSSESKMSAVTIILIVLSATQFITLVGVVVGWVWFCHRSAQRSSEADYQQSNQTFIPTFSSFNSSVPYVKMKSSPSCNEQPTSTTSHCQTASLDPHSGIQISEDN